MLFKYILISSFKKKIQKKKDRKNNMNDKLMSVIWTYILCMAVMEWWVSSRMPPSGGL